MEAGSGRWMIFASNWLLSFLIFEIFCFKFCGRWEYCHFWNKNRHLWVESSFESGRSKPKAEAHSFGFCSPGLCPDLQFYVWILIIFISPYKILHSQNLLITFKNYWFLLNFFFQKCDSLFNKTLVWSREENIQSNTINIQETLSCILALPPRRRYWHSVPQSNISTNWIFTTRSSQKFIVFGH